MQPVGEAVLRVLPVFRRRLETLIDHAAIFLSGDQLAKRVFALGGPAFTAGSGQAVKGEAVNAFFLQMQEGALNQRGVVGCAGKTNVTGPGHAEKMVSHCAGVSMESSI